MFTVSVGMRVFVNVQVTSSNSARSISAVPAPTLSVWLAASQSMLVRSQPLTGRFSLRT